MKSGIIRRDFMQKIWNEKGWFDIKSLFQNNLKIKKK
jgi:hypothetical protein